MKTCAEVEPIDRFMGSDADKTLVRSLLQQSIVKDSRELADALSKAVQLHQFEPGEVLIEQGRADRDLMFILLGEVSIKVNGYEIARRGAGFHVGEMACIDPSATRSATVCARSKTVAGKIDEPTFSRIANMHPEIWRSIATELGNRLRQRSQFVRVRNEIPILFLGSSSESLPTVKGTAEGMKDFDVIVRQWTHGVFKPSHFPIDDLSRQVENVDFAALVFGPDDKIFSRWTFSRSPRDNVILELGLFMGALSRERTFVVTPSDRKVKIPTDLLGMAQIRYRLKPGSLASSMNTACEELKERIQSLGPR